MRFRITNIVLSLRWSVPNSSKVQESGLGEIADVPCGKDILRNAEKYGIGGLNLPVLVIDHNIRVQAANEPACRLLSKNHFQIQGHAPGEVIQCVHAEEPGGCGQTVHCLSCVLRQTVTHTMIIGKECRNVMADSDTPLPGAGRRIHYLISTEMLNNFVCLTIHEAKSDVSSSY